jgi:hypothetical protein
VWVGGGGWGGVEERLRGSGEDGDHEDRKVLCSQHRRGREEGQRGGAERSVGKRNNEEHEYRRRWCVGVTVCEGGCGGGWGDGGGCPGILVVFLLSTKQTAT